MADFSEIWNNFKKTVDNDKFFYYTTIVNFEIWSHGQVVKTSPFHGGNRGSSPLGTTKKTHPLGCFFVFKGAVCSAHKQLALFEPLLHREGTRDPVSCTATRDIWLRHIDESTLGLPKNTPIRVFFVSKGTIATQFFANSICKKNPCYTVGVRLLSEFLNENNIFIFFNVNYRLTKIYLFDKTMKKTKEKENGIIR